MRENHVEMRRIEDEISHNNVLNCDNWNDIQSRTEEEGEGDGDNIGESEIPSHPNVDDDDNNTNEENNQIDDDC